MTRPTPAPAPAPVTVRTSAWSYRPSERRITYTLEQRARLTFRVDTIVHVDSASSVAEVAFTFIRSGSRMNGSVNSFQVGGGGRAAAVPSGLSLPFPFVASYADRGKQLAFLAPSAAPCVSPAVPVAQSLRDLWFQAPDTLRVGAAWEDAGTYTSCRDGVPLNASVRRSFRVTAVHETGGQLQLTIVRSARTAFDGSGVQSGEPVTVAGSSTGELEYTVDPTAGEVVSAHGSSTLELTLTNKLRVQAVHQVNEIRIARAP